MGHISNKALVKGDVNAMVLEIEEGAVVEGAIRKNVHLVNKPEMHPEPEEASTAAPADAVAPDEEEQTTSWF